MGSDDDKLRQTTTLQTVQSILHARQRAEQDLRDVKEALEEETRVLELLNKTGEALASKLELKLVLQTVTDAATQLSGAQFGAFFYKAKNADRTVFSLYTLSGASRDGLEGLGQPHPRETPLLGPTFRGECVVRIDDVRKDPRYGQMPPHHGMPDGHLPVCSYLAAPVVARSGEVLGALLFSHRKPGVFTERSERLIVGIAAQAAIAIDNARLYEEVKDAAEERARLLDAERIARAEVERVSLLKDEFLATLSHELRTPLNAVLGWSDILLSRSDVEAPARRGLEAIVRNARSQAQLIDDLLDMNRILSGKIRLDVQAVDLHAVVEASIDSVRPSADAKTISIHSTLDPETGTVFGDPNRLQQIVWNLLTNAVKFTPKGGHVDLGLRRIDSHVELTVRDSGVGIAPSFLPFLFERFRQADASTTRKFGGLGIGLSIVKHLVELHGGTVKADSPGEGRGATFSVTLPLRAIGEREADRPGPKDIVPIHRDSAVSLAGIRIVVVDDEQDARELLQLVLDGASAEVYVASSAEEGLALVKKHHPDIIVSDIGMPERDGYQFIHDVRTLTNGDSRTPAIALTAFARPEDRTRAMLAGYQVHVAKPIEPPQLIATIKSLAHSRPRTP
jgi:signal transduction histidine kinase/ActR/RegA family two-component response regulator